MRFFSGVLSAATAEDAAKMWVGITREAANERHV